MSAERQQLLPCGRIVQGHPMEAYPALDNAGKPKMDNLGNPMVKYFTAVAITKGAETHWNQTQWGAVLYQSGVEGWPNGEHGRPDFSWKVVDGDSQIPDKKGRKPSEKEGFPGHWVLSISSMFDYPCYHAGKYSPHERIQNPKEIKNGDYVRVEIKSKGNGPVCQSPGIYINPLQLELSRAGIEIVSANMPDAATAFGGSTAALPTNAMIDQSVAPVAAAVNPVAAIQQPAPAAAIQQPAPAAAIQQPAPAAAIQQDPVLMIPGLNYAEHIAAGWTNETLISNGMATAHPNDAPTPQPGIAAPPAALVQAAPAVSSAPVAPAGNAYLQP